MQPDLDNPDQSMCKSTNQYVNPKKMILKTLPVGIIQTNCYIVGCEETHEGVVIDPGGHPKRILDTIEQNNLTIRYVLNTHCHFDHMAANAEIVAATGAPLALHQAEIPLLKAKGGASLFAMSLSLIHI